MPPEGGIRLPWAQIYGATGVHQGVEEQGIIVQYQGQRNRIWTFNPKDAVILSKVWRALRQTKSKDPEEANTTQ